MDQEKKLDKMMEKQNKAIIKTLKAFLKHFDKPFYAIVNPVQELDKFFDLNTDWDWIIYIAVRTSEWDFTMGYTTDIDIGDIQSVINWLKRRADNALRFEYDDYE